MEDMVLKWRWIKFVYDSLYK